MFRGFKEQGILKDPAEVARSIVAKLVFAPVENGRTYAHTDLGGLADQAHRGSQSQPIVDERNSAAPASHTRQYWSPRGAA